MVLVLTGRRRKKKEFFSKYVCGNNHNVNNSEMSLQCFSGLDRRAASCTQCTGYSGFDFSQSTNRNRVSTSDSLCPVL